jgi:hypothetical protein
MRKKLEFRDNFISKNYKYVNNTTKSVNLWQFSIWSLSLQRNVVLPQTSKEKTRIYSLTCYQNLQLKNII